ncbi:uncharacterized protein LOC122869855 isoform X2 [Siniperca chuatsi]|uniref:uncharacterized protein LOC122869855 isoform X2 n=1 Tax=Siniperca chuatsi TaxID=119488 RepID=UPI001CE1B803|nr:uncharacterized protein LOC122869855 isoform X2 [Siniperca chuatsi]
MNTMTPLKFAMYLTCLFLGRIAQMTELNLSIYVRQESGFYSANVGESLTLRCFYEGDAVMFYWYKQTLGQKPRLISTFYKHKKSATLDNEFKKNPRFTLDTGNEGATVSVKGSGLNIQALVHQSASETIQPGGSVTLNCTVHTGTCDGEHSVYWFRNSEESHPGLMYTHGGKNDQCERKPNTQTHTCFYNLPLTSLNLSHAGTYYCAVAACGHILFGNGTKLDLEYDSFLLVYFLIGALAFTTILVGVLAYAAYTMNKRNSCRCTDSRSSAALTPNAEDYQDSDNLHYAALSVHKVNRSTRQRGDTQSECVYSSVRQ